MNDIIPSVEQASIEIKGRNQRFPVRRIYCVGRNYRAHAIEMGADPGREPPFFFMKPADAIVENGANVPYPPQTSNLHHEVELVVAIGKAGKDIVLDEALEHVWGYAVGIDLTRRDLQKQAKETCRPWDMAKGFDHSAPCSALSPVSEVGHPDTGNTAIWLKVNGETKQQSSLNHHIWSTAETIQNLSQFCELMPGDLIFMGTPDGVSPVNPGDTIEGHIDGIGDLAIHMKDA